MLMLKCKVHHLVVAVQSYITYTINMPPYTINASMIPYIFGGKKVGDS